MIGRIVRSVDFERVLRTRARVNSVHFAVHHLAAVPSKPIFAAQPSTLQREDRKLSTDRVGDGNPSVDERTASAPVRSSVEAFGDVWLGLVVPKRHAKRAVTRTLLKRQIRSAMVAEHALLASGLWVIRLRAPFDRAQFPSAASEAMKCLARGELLQLLASAVGRSDRRPVHR